MVKLFKKVQQLQEELGLRGKTICLNKLSNCMGLIGFMSLLHSKTVIPPNVLKDGKG